MPTGDRGAGAGPLWRTARFSSVCGHGQQAKQAWQLLQRNRAQRQSAVGVGVGARGRGVLFVLQIQTQERWRVGRDSKVIGAGLLRVGSNVKRTLCRAIE